MRIFSPPTHVKGDAAGRPGDRPRLPFGLTPKALMLASMVAATLVLLSIDTLASAGRIRPRVQAGSLALGGMRFADAEQALTERARLLASTPATLAAGEEKIVVEPDAVSFLPDVDATLERARAVGREGNLIVRVWQRTRSRVASNDVGWRSSLDIPTLNSAVGAWAGALDDPGREAGIEAQGATLVAFDAIPGRSLDQPSSVRTVWQALESWPRQPAELPFETIGQRTDLADAETAAERANGWVRAPITLSGPDNSVELSSEELAAMLEAVPHRSGGEWRLRLQFSPQRVENVLGPSTEQFERSARSATFAVSGSSVSIRPSQDGLRFDAEGTAEALATAAASAPPRSAEAQFETVRPGMTTEDARALRITELVSTFTTNHPAGQPRVRNIHLMADAVDGTIVRPGDVFSLNRAVGQRTADKGYVSAPMIYDGEYRDQVGGGVSQFATTIFNTVFFGGYEFVSYRAHSYYISRYPAGREATISWPTPDFRFRNNSDAGVLIKTSYSSTSITVSIYGTKWATVRAESGDRTNITPPPERREADDSLAPGREVVRQSGSNGFDIVVWRVLTRDGNTRRERFFTRYQPEPRIIAFGPGTPEPTPEPAPQPPDPGPGPTPQPTPAPTPAPTPPGVPEGN